MMYQDEAKILKKDIENNENIIVMAHKMPDGDAYGSQLGLFLSLKKAYPAKKIYAVASEYPEPETKKYYTEVDDSVFSGSLVIIVDTPAPNMAADERYTLAKKTIVIDHHDKRTAFGDYEIIDTSAVSACQIIYFLIETLGIETDNAIAKYLMTGLITDSGRFRYQGVTSHTFYAASKLMVHDVPLNDMYNRMYENSLEFMRYRGLVLSSFHVKNKVAYMKNTKEMIEKSGLAFGDVSRGMINSMADIKGIEIWSNFTYSEDGIYAEIRSKSITVNHIAAKFGGGGHALACGATLKSWDVADMMIEELIDCCKE